MIHLDICVSNRTFKVSVQLVEDGDYQEGYIGSYCEGFDFKPLLKVATSVKFHDTLDIEECDCLTPSTHAAGIIDFAYVEPFFPYIPIALPTKRRLMMSPASVCPDFKYGSDVVLLYGSMIRTNSSLESHILQWQILNTASCIPQENQHWMHLARDNRYLHVSDYIVSPSGKIHVNISGGDK